MNIPDPVEVLSLKPGGVYALKFDTLLGDNARNSIQHHVATLAEETGCKFIILDRSVNIVRVEEPGPHRVIG